VAEARVAAKGLAFDRRWMLIDENNQFLTQRTNPALALFQVTLGEQNLTFRFRQERYAIRLDARVGDVFAATVWDDTVAVHRCSEAIDQWFSTHLRQPVRLVAFPEENPRQVDLSYSVEGDWVSLADGYPFLVIGQASLDDLNTRLENPVSMNRFRPNFVFTGGAPYEEDSWRKFAIGSVHFAGVKPCSRCVMVTVDQATSEKGAEPLATLAGYRKQNGKVYFGQNVLAQTTGLVRVGDEIVIE
jgi:uncharacterized protein YcbX